MADNPKTKLVIDKRSTDFERAKTILDEVYAVMVKHNAVLAIQRVHMPGDIHAGRSADPNYRALVLALVEPGTGTARVIAELRQITPEMIEQRRILWNGEMLIDPFLT